MQAEAVDGRIVPIALEGPSTHEDSPLARGVVVHDRAHHEVALAVRRGEPQPVPYSDTLVRRERLGYPESIVGFERRPGRRGTRTKLEGVSPRGRQIVNTQFRRSSRLNSSHVAISY